jgi:hypothetical protein
MAKFPNELAEIIWNLKRQLLEIIDAATVGELTLFELFGETSDTMPFLDELKSVAELNDTLFDRGITVRTFPQVFLDDEHIGGYTELYARVAMSNYDFEIFEIDDDCF